MQFIGLLLFFICIFPFIITPIKLKKAPETRALSTKAMVLSFYIIVGVLFLKNFFPLLKLSAAFSSLHLVIHIEPFLLCLYLYIAVFWIMVAMRRINAQYKKRTR